MALTVISNFAANVAHRNLVQSDMEATRSLARLSSGQRVVSARDDAASMAIGSRLRAEVSALRAARVNAGQAVSMLQVAEGAMGQIDGILVRLKSLSIQAGSGQFGSVERGLIDTEFQQLVKEIDRIAQDTEFNGAKLLDGGALSVLVNAGDPSSDGIAGITFDASVEDNAVFNYSYDAQNGEILTITKLGVSNIASNKANELFDRTALSFTFDPNVASDAVYTYQFNQTTDTFTLTNQTSGDAVTLDLTNAILNAFGAGADALPVPASQSLAITFDSLGVTVNFEEGFDFNAVIAAPTLLTSNITNYNANSAVTFPSGLSDAAITALDTLITGNAGVLDINVTDGAANINLAATAGVQFSVNGGTVAAVPADNLESGTNTVEAYIDVDGNGTFETQIASVNLILGAANNDGALDRIRANINLAATAGVQFSVNGGTVAAVPADNLESGTNTVEAYIDVDGNGTFETQIASVNLILGAANNDGARTFSVDYTQVLSNTQTNVALEDQSVQIDLTDQLDAVAGAGNNLSFDQTLDVDISQFGVNITLDKGFDRTVTVTTTIGTVTATPAEVTAATFTPNSKFLSAEVYQALLGLGFNSTTGVGYNPVTGVLNLRISDDTAGAGGNVTLAALPGINFGTGEGNATGDLAATDPNVTIAITLADGTSVDLGTLAATYADTGGPGALGTIDIQLGRGVFYNQVDPNATVQNFTFKIGTGNENSDDITIDLTSVNLSSLGLSGSSVTTEANADATSTAVSDALTLLSGARANIGALQNRLDITHRGRFRDAGRDLRRHRRTRRARHHRYPTRPRGVLQPGRSERDRPEFHLQDRHRQRK